MTTTLSIKPVRMQGGMPLPDDLPPCPSSPHAHALWVPFVLVRNDTPEEMAEMKERVDASVKDLAWNSAWYVVSPQGFGTRTPN